MARMSNKARIAQAAEEARITAEEKATKKATKKTTKKATKKATPGKARAGSKAQPERLKIVWEVCNATGKPVKAFPYPEKAAAEAQVQALIKSSGRTHLLRATKVPMAPDE